MRSGTKKLLIVVKLQEIGKCFIDIMRNYEERVKEAGSGFHMNPSPGNVKDGLITDAIKSAGAAKRGNLSNCRCI